MEGINVHNLLTAEPHGRNPCLMDALKRTGLAERTGRGIDRIFEGALNYGRPLPDYSRSNGRGVSVLLPRSAPDEAFVELLAEERERSGKSMSLDGLLILDKLKRERRCGFDALSESLDMSDQRLRTVLGQLTESGLSKAPALTLVVHTHWGRKCIGAAVKRWNMSDSQASTGCVTPN